MIGTYTKNDYAKIYQKLYKHTEIAYFDKPVKSRYVDTLKSEINRHRFLNDKLQQYSWKRRVQILNMKEQAISHNMYNLCLLIRIWKPSNNTEKRIKVLHHYNT